jgi:hypothetical protein
LYEFLKNEAKIEEGIIEDCGGEEEEVEDHIRVEHDIEDIEGLW